MNRREFITLLGGAAVAWPVAARAQGERMRRIGVLLNSAADDPAAQSRLTVFLQGLQELGWTHGRNVRVDIRWGADDAERVRKSAAELVALGSDVVLAAGSPTTRSPSRACIICRRTHPKKSVRRCGHSCSARAIDPGQVLNAGAGGTELYDDPHAMQPTTFY